MSAVEANPRTRPILEATGRILVVSVSGPA
jgi:hypothetical protein